MTEAGPDEERYVAISELRRLGVSESEIIRLVSSYPLERIQRQLRWLALRKVWKAAAFIVAAIIGDYDPPAAMYEEAALNSPESAAPSSNSPSSGQIPKESTDEN